MELYILSSNVTEREEFLNGKFKIGNFVCDDTGLFEVLDIGTNYLTVISEDLVISKKWPNKVELTESKFIPNYFNSKIIPDIINEKYSDSLNEYNEGKFSDKHALVNSYKRLDEFFINNDIEHLLKSISLLENIGQYIKFKDLLEMHYDKATVTPEEKLEAAEIFANAFSEQVKSSPEETVNNILENYEITQEIQEMLDILENNFGIAYNKELLESTQEDHLHPQPNYSDHEQVDDTGIDFSHKSDTDLENMTDDELDNLINTHLTSDDYYEDYPEDQLTVVDSVTGEVINPEINEEALNEVLSRMERLRSRIRFHRTEAKRERKLHIALTKKSDTKTIMHRARRLAVKALELKLARKPLDTLSISEKERIEQRIQKAKPILNRLTLRLINKVRQLEQKRLHEGFND